MTQLCTFYLNSAPERAATENNTRLPLNIQEERLPSPPWRKFCIIRQCQVVKVQYLMYIYNPAIPHLRKSIVQDPVKITTIAPHYQPTAASKAYS